MLAGVLGACHDFEIFGTIVVAYFVAMMDDLIVPKGAPEHLGRQKAMLCHIAALDAEVDITVADVSAPFPTGVSDAFLSKACFCGRVADATTASVLAPLNEMSTCHGNGFTAGALA